LSVRANAQSLRRVHEFLKKLSMDAMTQVDMEASVVEVGLTKDFSLGIQWQKVAQTALGGTGIGTNVGTNLATAVGGLATGTNTPAQTVSALVSASAEANGLSAFRLGASTASIINALQSYSDVKIVSQPRLFSMNNTPATFFDGTQIPYLGSVTSTAATVAGGAPTVSGTTSFAINGLSFSVIPSVVDKDRVQITLIPVISKVGEFQTFTLGSSGTLKVPTQTNQQTYMRVLAESGKTLVIGGIRQGTDTKSTSVLASTGNSSSTRELVILLRANVIQAPEFDPVVAEAI
jgi:general secretion pathway protein D